MEKWTEKNREKVNAKNRIIRQKFKDEQNKSRSKRMKIECINLTDQYIKNIIVRSGELKYTQIPQWMVEVKRDLMKLKRKINELKNVK